MKSRSAPSYGESIFQAAAKKFVSKEGLLEFTSKTWVFNPEVLNVFTSLLGF